MVLSLAILGVIINGLTLYLPALIAEAIDTYTQHQAGFADLVFEFGLFSFLILIFTVGQVVLQAFASEYVARDLRRVLINKIARQNYRFITEHDPAKLLTNITSDMTAVKQFIAQAVVSIISSAVMISGVAVVLLYTDWRLGLAVLSIVPVIAIVFFVIFTRVRKLFAVSREIIDDLNRVIGENIFGSALIRVLNSTAIEKQKFSTDNDKSREIGYGIVRLFSFLVPTISLVASLGTLIVVYLGGYYVTTGAMTIGSFVAFISYVAILIFPILVIGFIGNIIAQASASYNRIWEVLVAPDDFAEGNIEKVPTGAIMVKNLSLQVEQKLILNNISFQISPGTKNAIIGPTGAGKTQLLNIMVGLTKETSGEVLFDGKSISEYKADLFYPYLGLVFQDSVLFNTTVRENIAFSTTVTDEALDKAVRTAELDDFINSLPHGLDTIISERGTTLSGGQKQRLMLARALALNPQILFLDDFTARVDMRTEKRILENIAISYPKMTLISITQKIKPIQEYDQIILLMEGDLLATGTHFELLQESAEYQQIYQSQRSTENYELQS